MLLRRSLSAAFWPLLAQLAPLALASPGCREEGGACEADDASLLAHRPTSRVLEAAGQRRGAGQPHRAAVQKAARSNATARAASSRGFDDDLYRPNYDKQTGMWCVGINAVGFDLDATSGRHGHYSKPSQEQIQYMHDQGANCFRLPITWERLQYNLGDGSLNPVDGVTATVDFITQTLGDYVIIDPHNNNQGLQFNGVDAKKWQFVNLWRAIAQQWGGNAKAIFGLYNEPRYGHENGVDGYFDPDALDRDGAMIERWRQWMQESIDAIRGLGSSNLILVPGLHWTSSRDWSGSYWWGETLHGVPNAGNTRLAALTDPQNNIAYDVHQYMDPKFTGEERGCGGHDHSYWGGEGADWGLQQTIQWAWDHSKKLMMTEIGSWPTDTASDADCKVKMSNYLQSMADSGVFIGYQVWQFGCPQCLADQWTKRPYNLDWYRWADFGRKGSSEHCSPEGSSCLETRCCTDAGKACYEKDQWWAQCMDSCTPGISPWDPPEYQTSWSCHVLGS
mmetsp:Transcript_49430/g.152491  ORF Transcript_49430/g.152491 Transcript_49430/m.152491 type:complete len:506 (-) Transcript_49430:76-1593(-)